MSLLTEIAELAQDAAVTVDSFLLSYRPYMDAYTDNHLIPECRRAWRAALKLQALVDSLTTDDTNHGFSAYENILIGFSILDARGELTPPPQESKDETQ